MRIHSTSVRTSLLIAFVFIVGLSLLSIAAARGGSSPDEKDFLPIPPMNENDHVSGVLSAPVHIFLYSDPECSYCKQWDQTVMPRLKQEFGEKIAIAYRHRLVSKYTRSRSEAHAMECAALVGGGDTAFWQYTHALFSKTPSENNLDPAVLRTIASEQNLPLEKFDACMLGNNTVEAKITKDVRDASIAEFRVSTRVVVARADGSKFYIVNGSYYGPARTATLLMLDAKE